MRIQGCCLATSLAITILEEFEAPHIFRRAHAVQQHRRACGPVHMAAKPPERFRIGQPPAAAAPRAAVRIGAETIREASPCRHKTSDHLPANGAPRADNNRRGVEMDVGPRYPSIGAAVKPSALGLRQRGQHLFMVPPRDRRGPISATPRAEPDMRADWRLRSLGLDDPAPSDACGLRAPSRTARERLRHLWQRCIRIAVPASPDEATAGPSPPLSYQPGSGWPRPASRPACIVNRRRTTYPRVRPVSRLPRSLASEFLGTPAGRDARGSDCGGRTGNRAAKCRPPHANARSSRLLPT